MHCVSQHRRAWLLQLAVASLAGCTGMSHGPHYEVQDSAGGPHSVRQRGAGRRRTANVDTIPRTPV